MGVYEKYVLPKLVHWACSTKPSMRQRAKVVPMAEGRVLEIGIGSGLNLPYYDADRVTKVWGLEPSPELTQMARTTAGSVKMEVEFIPMPAEEIPLDDGCVDTVLVTYTLCTIPDTDAALRQVARVLKPDGWLIFCEHGAAPDPRVRRWQNRLDPVWARLAGGCHLNRAIPRLLEQGGFSVEAVDTMYLPGWRPATFNYWGAARPR